MTSKPRDFALQTVGSEALNPITFSMRVTIPFCDLLGLELARHRQGSSVKDCPPGWWEPDSRKQESIERHPEKPIPSPLCYLCYLLFKSSSVASVGEALGLLAWRFDKPSVRMTNSCSRKSRAAKFAILAMESSSPIPFAHRRCYHYKIARRIPPSHRTAAPFVAGSERAWEMSDRRRPTNLDEERIHCGVLYVNAELTRGGKLNPV